MRHILPLLLLVASLAAYEPTQIRVVAEKAGPAVLTLRVVTTVKIAIMGQNRTIDHESESVGVVVDADGSTAAGLLDLDPSSLFKTMFGGNPMIKFDSELKECALRLADGTEVAMDIVVKDADLGLAILRPKQAGRTFPALVPLAGARLELGDHALVVSRAARHVASTVLVSEVAVAGVVGGPQPYALVPLAQAMSAAVCDAQGRLLGLACAKEAPAPPANAEAGNDPLMGLTAGLEAKNRVPVPIVRPADAVAKLVAQAKAKTPAK
jgi:hypothetical protein